MRKIQNILKVKRTIS